MPLTANPRLVKDPRTLATQVLTSGSCKVMRAPVEAESLSQRVNSALLATGANKNTKLSLCLENLELDQLTRGVNHMKKNSECLNVQQYSHRSP